MNALFLAAALLGAPNVETLQTKSVTIEMKDGSSGSGIVVGGSMVLTCKHVVKDEKEGFVTKSNGLKIPFKVEKVSDKYDMALLEVQGVTFDTYTDFDTDINVGEEVWHVGAWFGPDGADSVSHGIVSKRSGDYYQTTAFSIFGGSGGGVYDEDGECVGMMCQIMRAKSPFGDLIPLPITYILPSRTLMEFIAPPPIQPK